MLKEDLKICRIHIETVRNQYAELRSLKKNLANDHVAIQMNFAENYMCSSAAAIQSEYWNKEFVAFHPCVIYYKSNGSLQHKSVVSVSDELSHGCGMVYAFIKQLIPIAQGLVADLKYVHYMTDSPTSHYRNKHISYLIHQHSVLVGPNATWQFF